MSELAGKVAFVTGGGSGIGQAVARRIAADGADIFIPDVDVGAAQQTVDLVTQLGRRAVAVRANVASKQDLQQAAAQCVEQLGGLDIAVANAGIGRGGSVLDMSVEDWQLQLDVNLTGVFLTVQACAQQMVKLGSGGRIVCLSSLAAENTSATMWAYSATKSGVRMMVRGWAQDLGPHGITVNAIGPGVIHTPLAEGLAGEEGGKVRASLEARTPVGRVGQPDDIAGLVRFMSGRDGAFMSGSYVVMDGGLRDAVGGWDPDDQAMEEIQRTMLRAQQRQQKLETLMRSGED